MQLTINGNRYYANDGGVPHESGRPNLVFIHGAGMDHSNWVLFNRYFSRNGFNTFAVDLPGSWQIRRCTTVLGGGYVPMAYCRHGPGWY